ncbi:MAG: SCP-like extracellular [Ruminococcus sp.]|nr:SCP-like extracellular [Ruminococcus sp.]
MKKTNRLFTRVISALSAVVMATAGAVNFTMKTDAAYDEPDFVELAEQVIVLVNEARAEAGLNPIYATPYLCDVAETRAEECVENFSHSRANGDSFIQAVDYDVIKWATAGENIACGMSTPEDTFEQWRNSPSHWAAIMNPDYTHMGVGVTYDPDSVYGWYWEQLFIKVDTYAVPSGEIEGQYIPDRYKIVPQSTGDIDGDGVIDSFDYVLLCQYLTKQTTLNPLQMESADILVDGVITYSDAAFLRKYILGQIDEIPYKLF